MKRYSHSNFLCGARFISQLLRYKCRTTAFEVKLMEFDIIIENGLVVDGGGSKPVKQDIGIKNDKIIELGDLKKSSAKKRIDAKGKIVSPGFIDAHSHSDFAFLMIPNADSKLHQGITTEVIGCCGSSAFPLYDEAKKRTQEEFKKYDLKIDWSTAQEYFEKITKTKVAVNVVPFIGQGTIRASIMGYEDRKPSADELKKMKYEVEKAMDNGVFGLSTGLIYSPGYFADTDEIIKLAKVCKKHNGIYTSHIRGEGDTLLEAIEEALKIGKEADIPVEISHIKASGQKNWGKVAKAIEMIEKSNTDGDRNKFDKYPYIASATDLASLLPRWVQDGGYPAIMKKINDVKSQDKIFEDVEKERETISWSDVLITFINCEKHKDIEGMSVDEISKKFGLSHKDTFFKILIDGDLDVGIASFTMNQEETDMVLTHPLGMLCTDSSAYTPTGKYRRGNPHPRTYGSFPRYIRQYVRENKKLSIQEAIRKITSLPATQMRLKNRGLLKKGYFADIVIFDLEKINDKATFKDPHQFPEGINYIIINGKIRIIDNKDAGENSGSVLVNTK